MQEPNYYFLTQEETKRLREIFSFFYSTLTTKDEKAAAKRLLRELKFIRDDVDYSPIGAQVGIFGKVDNLIFEEALNQIRNGKKSSSD